MLKWIKFLKIEQTLEMKMIRKNWRNLNKTKTFHLYDRLGQTKKKLFSSTDEMDVQYSFYFFVYLIRPLCPDHSSINEKRNLETQNFHPDRLVAKRKHSLSVGKK